jgi:ferredoxin--NADP+ reductase
MHHIAIVGSGPAGCYLADSLLRILPDAWIDVIERLPVPFGLIRYGVAPDHQSTKAIARVLDRALARDRVAFFGNVEVGRDVRLDELLANYDAVALAVGAPRDRTLGIPGENLPGVFGSGAFVNWYNGHPDGAAPDLRAVHAAVIIGNGNVAIDVARTLAKDSAELAGSDLSPGVSAALQAMPIERIHIVGRRGPSEAKFTEHELAELESLTRAGLIVHDPSTLQGEGGVIETLRRFHTGAPRSSAITIRFHFGLTPIAFEGTGSLERVRFRGTEATAFELPAQLAVTAIGYEARACCSVQPANGAFANDQGRIGERLYVAGWAKRGPTGTIPANRAEAQEVAQRIGAEIAGSERPGRTNLRALLDARGVLWTDYAAWRRIDAAEIARAPEGRCRDKFSSVDEMLEVAGNSGNSSRKT